jgi:hypothetical protein
VYTMLHALVVFAAGGCIGSTPRRDTVIASSVDSCAITVLEQRRLRLRDGSWVAMEPLQAARNGAVVIVVGRNTRLWSSEVEASAVPRNATPLPRSDSIIGLIIGPDDSVREIPNPFPGARVVSSRISSTATDSWHVLIAKIAPAAAVATASSGDLPNDMVADSAALWHGTFDGHRWRDTASIVARQAWLSPDFSSDLVSHGNEVAFAYAIGKPIERALVLVRRQDGAWNSDTLVHSTGPEVRLSNAADGWLVAFAARDIYVAAFHPQRRWAAPRVAVRAAESTLLDPQLVVSKTTPTVWFAVRHGAADSTVTFGLFAKQGLADDAPLIRIVPSGSLPAPCLRYCRTSPRSDKALRPRVRRR